MASASANPTAGAGEAERAAWLERGRHLFAQDCRFLISAVEPEQIPDFDRVEFAFAGRSNVGKSSLINALTGRKTLARISNTPGRTQQLNFFDLGERAILVDLPGYGYARASKRAVKAWTAFTRAYLKGRPALRRVCLLIDARHGLKPIDREVMQELDEAAVSYQLVLTKADKLKPAEQRAVVAAVSAEAARHPAAHPDCLSTSAVTGLGIAELRASLAALTSAV